MTNITSSSSITFCSGCCSLINCPPLMGALLPKRRGNLHLFSTFMPFGYLYMYRSPESILKDHPFSNATMVTTKSQLVNMSERRTIDNQYGYN
jgi:hypothetical protein